MDFYEVLDDVLELLRRRGRVTYRALKVQFQLDDEQLEALKEEIIYAQKWREMRITVFWYGLGKLREHWYPPLNPAEQQCQRRQKLKPFRSLHHPLQLTPLKRNADNSPSCS